MSEQPHWIGEVLGAQRGDLEAHAALLARFTPLARSTASRLTDRADQVDDVCQESFIEAFRTVERLRAPEAFPAWLRLIVRKHADRARRTDRPTEDLAEHEAAVSTAEQPEHAAERRLAADAVQAALAALRDTDRRLLELRYLAGWSTSELAAAFGTTEGALRKRLHTARRRARPLLEPIHEREERTMTPLDDLLGHVHDAARLTVPAAPAVSRPSPLRPDATGIKVIDTMAPVARGGTIEMVGPTGTGHLVLAVELALRLGRTEHETVCVGVGARTAAVGSQPNLGALVTDVDVPGRNAVILHDGGDRAVHALTTSAALARGFAGEGVDVLLIVDQATHDGAPAVDLGALAGVSQAGGSVTLVLVNPIERGSALPEPAGLDTRLVFSLEPFALGIFPALDPIRSSSTIGDSAVAAEVRSLLARAAAVRSSFGQPLRVAEAYTGESGEWVDLADAESELAALIA